MANKRTIKKSLQYIMNDMLTATLLATAKENADQEKILKVQTRIITVYQDYNSRLSNYERKNAKAFFRQFRESINKELAEIVDQINSL